VGYNTIGATWGNQEPELSITVYDVTHDSNAFWMYYLPCHFFSVFIIIIIFF
jgi:hypothetical protein